VRISFDIDDTLVCGPALPAEPSIPRWKRLWYPESLRRGTRDLMHALIRRRHEIWVYTTSYRSPSYIRGWFRSFRIPISGVVNQDRHERVVGRHGPSKFPPAFGIDLHIDDSTGVAEEGRRHGLEVIVVAPEDADWTARILEAVEGRPRADPL
jgi:hypothetical protein